MSTVKDTYGRTAEEIAGATRYIDPPLKNTIIGRSTITYIDGEQGILRHRGFDIKDLALNGSYLETSYLILDVSGNEKLPNEVELREFENSLAAHRGVPDRVFNVLNGFGNDASPMDMLNAMTVALGGHYRKTTNVKTPEGRYEFAQTYVAQAPELAAAAYRHTQGLPPIAPRPDLNHVQNFYHMCFGQVPSPLVERALDVFFILHADHEQNASTTAAKIVASTGADPFVAMAGATGALSGGKHGGANQNVMILLEKIANGQDTIEAAIDRALDPKIKDLVPGIGHRVYTAYDPRADVLQGICSQILDQLDTSGVGGQLFERAKKLEQAVLKHPKFIENRKKPNVDFYSGLILKAIGFPPEMFPVLFAVGRSVGWAAQMNERLAANLPIIRPDQLYVGQEPRAYVLKNERGGPAPDGEGARQGIIATGATVLTAEAK